MKYKYRLLILFWFISKEAYFWLHEFAGHYAANLLYGISMDQMEIIWQRLKLFNIIIRPIGVTVLEGEIPKITPFAGGFVAGLLFLLLSIILFWRLKGKRKQEQFWGFFAIALGFSGTGITEFAIEGSFTEYHSGIVEAVLLGFFIYIPPLIIIWYYRNEILDLVKNLKSDKLKK